MQHAIGIDLGGSSAKLALVSQTGEILAHDMVAIASGLSAEATLDPVAAAVDRLCRLGARLSLSIGALGCGFSGYLDDTRTTIEQNNTACLNGFALERWLRARFGLSVAVDNDACVAAVAETRRLQQTGRRRILFVTVGSGIGTVLVVDGAIARIVKGITGDSSHLIVDRGSAVRCPYGCYGCLETVASARAIARWGEAAARDGSSPALSRVAAEQRSITGLDVAEASARGDTGAQQILARAGAWLGIGLASLACVYVPDMILLGGAVSRAGDVWFQSVVSGMQSTGTPFSVPADAVATATLGNQAGVIGAAFMAMQMPG